MAQSYAAVDDPNIGKLDLSAQCKDRGAVDFSSELVVQLSPDGTDPLDPSTSTVSAESAQAQCSSSTAICVVPPNLRLVMSSSLNVPALIVRGELYWRDTDQGSAEQWLCGGYIAVEDGGKFIMNLANVSIKLLLYGKKSVVNITQGRTNRRGECSNGVGSALMQLQHKLLELLEVFAVTSTVST